MPKQTKTAPPPDDPTPPEVVDEPGGDDGEVTFTYNDITVKIPADADDWPTRAELARVKALNGGTLSDWLAFYEELLGPAQWAEVVDNLKRGEFFEFTRQFSLQIQKECAV